MTDTIIEYSPGVWIDLSLDSATLSSIAVDIATNLEGLDLEGMSADEFAEFVLSVRDDYAEVDLDRFLLICNPIGPPVVAVVWAEDIDDGHTELAALVRASDDDLGDAVVENVSLDDGVEACRVVTVEPISEAMGDELDEEADFAALADVLIATVRYATEIKSATGRALVWAAITTPRIAELPGIVPALESLLVTARADDDMGT